MVQTKCLRSRERRGFCSGLHEGRRLGKGVGGGGGGGAGADEENAKCGKVEVEPM